MDAADKIGLLPGFGWVVNWGSSWTSSLPLFWAILAVFALRLLTCWALTPIGHLVVGLVGEGRLIPLDSGRQFQSFYPGDIYLGTMAAALLTAATFLLPAEHHWYNSRLCHFIILGVALAVAVGLTIVDIRGDLFPFWAMVSPSKFYHNFLLYGGYGYFAGSTFLALIGGAVSSLWSWRSLMIVGALAIAILCGLPWMKLVMRDSSLGDTNLAALQRKAQYAHVPDWKFLGLIGPGSFHRSPTP